MSGPIEDFFASLDGTDQHGVFMGQSGALRFDIAGKGGRVRHWLVRSDKGVLTVSQGHDEAACVFATDEATFAALCEGRLNAMAALLRGAVDANGRGALLVSFEKLFPGPPEDEPERDVAGYARRRS